MVTLAAVVRRVESADGRALVRFEPACYQALQQGRGGLYALRPTEILEHIASANLCSPDTARMIFATSWGLYQDMGFELYGELCVSPDVVPSIAQWLGDAGLQDRMFAKWCSSHGFHAEVPLPDDPHLQAFARLYNGAGQVDSYVALMKKAEAALAMLPCRQLERS
jgi:hypothetical protein